MAVVARAVGKELAATEEAATAAAATAAGSAAAATAAVDLEAAAAGRGKGSQSGSAICRNVRKKLTEGASTITRCASRKKCMHDCIVDPGALVTLFSSS